MNHQTACFLQKLKVHGGQNQWESFRKALRSVWSEKNISLLEQQLARFKDEERVIQVNKEQSSRLNDLDLNTKKLVDAIIHQRDVFEKMHTILQRRPLEKSVAATTASLKSYDRRNDPDLPFPACAVIDLHQCLDLLEHFRLDAKVTVESSTHIDYKTDETQGICKEKVERRWHRTQCIGRGVFGVVWLEVREESGGVEKRAVKVIDKKMMQRRRVDYKMELLALSEFSKLQYEQEGVLFKFFGWFEDSSNIFLSMEYFELGDLEQHIGESLVEDDMKDITTDVLNSLRIIHSENFTHRDLKPGNIFVVEKPPASKWRVKIGDFGVSRRTGYVGADEPILVYENAVDMWSLGCIIYRIATKKIPFPTPKAVFKFCRGVLPFPERPLLAKISVDGAEFIKSLITPTPRDRLSAVSALEAPWLSREKRNTILKMEESSEHHVSVIAQTAKFNLGSPNEMGMSPHSVTPECGLDGPYVDFPRSSDVLFEHTRSLGAGSSGQVDEVRNKVNNKVFCQEAYSTVRIHSRSS
ncbi:MAG: hypothetical protein M1839_005484 [Geoglossum umbratile]|nr:MAG: hypothetical protein M1839_005484 [Geoglossum umbratile]